MQDGVGHNSLIDVLKILQSHAEHLIVKAAVVTQIKQNFPRLQKGANILKILKIGANFCERIWWIIQRWIKSD